MSSIASLISAGGPIGFGDPDGDDIKSIQLALSQAGYRVGVDGEFGSRTLQVLKQFQQQHGLKITGQVDEITAAMLDVPHNVLVAKAQGISKAAPNITHETPEPWIPHDDTASLIAFYGDPRGNGDQVSAVWHEKNVVPVDCPWELYYAGVAWPHPIQFHRRGVIQLRNAFDKIWQAAGKDNDSPILTHVKNFSGSGNYRPVRGSSRLSCHAFWAAIDWDAERLPMRYPGQPRFSPSDLPLAVHEAFASEGFTLGVDFTGRQDAMHIQLAHE